MTTNTNTNIIETVLHMELLEEVLQKLAGAEKLSEQCRSWTPERGKAERAVRAGRVDHADLEEIFEACPEAVKISWMQENTKGTRVGRLPNGWSIEHYANGMVFVY